jgi:hypothetical protein
LAVSLLIESANGRGKIDSLNWTALSKIADLICTNIPMIAEKFQSLNYNDFLYNLGTTQLFTQTKQ